MTNNFRMSYFMPPIAPIRNEQGQTVTPATLTPFCEVSVEQVYQMITCNENLKALTEQVRSAGDPIKYANIHSSYWEKHLAGFGRLSK